MDNHSLHVSSKINAADSIMTLKYFGGYSGFFGGGRVFVASPILCAFIVFGTRIETDAIIWIIASAT